MHFGSRYKLPPKGRTTNVLVLRSKQHRNIRLLGFPLFVFGLGYCDGRAVIGRPSPDRNRYAGTAIIPVVPRLVVAVASSAREKLLDSFKHNASRSVRAVNPRKRRFKREAALVKSFSDDH